MTYSPNSRWTPERLRSFHGDVTRSLDALPDEHPLSSLRFLDPDPRHVEGIEYEPPRRISVAVYVLGALFLVTALLVLWRWHG